MSKIDIPVYFSHDEAVSQTLRYARIDNTNTPVYQTISGVITSPYSIENLDNGQYRIGGTPIYADGRSCSETTFDTPACTSVIALNAVRTGNNIVVTYTVPDSVPQVRVNVSYPNGGSLSQTYTNGNSIIVPLPTNLFGTYTVTMQSVCDPDTGFYSPNSAPVTVEISQLYTVRVTSSAPGITNTEVGGISGFALAQSVIPGSEATGTHDAFTGVVYVVVTGTPVINEHVALYVNGSVTDCKNVTGAGTYSFNSDTYLINDLIEIFFDLGNCPS